MKLSTFAPLFLAAMASQAQAGLAAYGLCQTGCNSLVVSCYAAAGVIFGTVAGPLATPAVLACNAGLGVCFASCAAVALSPTP